jgi:TPR repeat protein
VTGRAPHYQRGLPFRLGGNGGTATDPFAEALRALGAADSAAALQSALDALLRLAREGRAEAAQVVGRLLWAIEGSAAEGVKWLRTAAEAGEAEALHLLGLAYFRGQGTEKDLARASQLQRQAAKRGVVDAQFELSLLLAQGIGGKRDLRGARRWEEKAAQAGHARACLNLGARLASGKKPDFVAASRWYERAAAGGSAEAAARLCKMHVIGQGVARDEAVAQRWFARAAELGYDWATEKR